MIVPQHWAEARVQHWQAGRTITVRRYGWSDTSAADAQAMAERRTQEALARLLAGETKLPRREPKVGYNGGAGLPIREEILGRHGSALITRNSYGARCLNTPDVLFVDVDYGATMHWQQVMTVAVTLITAGWLLAWLLHAWVLGLVLMPVAMLGAAPLSGALLRLAQRLRGGPEQDARRRIDRYLAAHPDWGLRLYRTPAGLRLLATHRTFQPDEPAVADCFAALGADPVYATMCRNQQCFRARLSAKPWRIGIADHLRPRPGVWPVAPERLPLRKAWVENYEARAQGHAACVFLEHLGNPAIAADVQPVLRLHDEQCRALVAGLSLA